MLLFHVFLFSTGCFSVFSRPNIPRINGIEKEDSINWLHIDTSTDDHNLLFSTSDQNYSIPVISAPSIFSPNFVMLTMSPDGESVINDLEAQPTLDGHFYVGKDGSGSFYVQKINGQLQVEGIIDDDFRIHNKDQVHKLVKIKKSEMSDVSADKDLREMVSLDNESFPQTNEISYDEADDTVTVELLVIHDQTHAKGFKDYHTSPKYFGVFFNSVQRRFADFQSPKIKLSIVGIVLVKDSIWITQSLLPSGEGDSMQLLRGLKTWLPTVKHRYPKYDIAMLLTGLDMAALDGNKINTGFAGLSGEGTVCQRNLYQDFSSGVAEDRNSPFYTGTLNVAHELGHILGAPHDGKDDAKSCAGQQFLMEPTLRPENKNKWRFSKCSIDLISKTVQSARAKCLRVTTPTKVYPLLKEWPSVDLDRLCQLLYHPGAKAAPKIIYDSEGISICNYLYCETRKGNYECKTSPPEGIPCDRNKRCVDGKCVPAKGRR